MREINILAHRSCRRENYPAIFAQLAFTVPDEFRMCKISPHHQSVIGHGKRVFAVQGKNTVGDIIIVCHRKELPLGTDIGTKKHQQQEKELFFVHLFKIMSAKVLILINIRELRIEFFG